jgi:hypothetical protein
MQIRPPPWLSALLVLGASTAFADTVDAPPPWPATRDSPAAAAVDPVRPLLMGSLRVVLDATTLADVRAALGTGVLARQGRGTDELDWLCYTLTDAAPAQRLWLTSSELSRGRIDGVTAVDLPAGAAASIPCPEMPARFKPVHFDDGLWLGTPSAELRRALGMPARAGAAFASMFHGRSGNLDLIGSLMIEFRGARATAIHVAHATQN